VINGSGFGFRRGFADFDAVRRFDIRPSPERTTRAVRRRDAGRILPPDCRLFGKRCAPENPVGPCMVSSEGACAAYYKYERPSQT